MLKFCLHPPSPPVLSTCNNVNGAPDQSAGKNLVEFLSHKSSPPHMVDREVSSPSAEVKFMNFLQLTPGTKEKASISLDSRPSLKILPGAENCSGWGDVGSLGTCAEKTDLLPRSPECTFATQRWELHCSHRIVLHITLFTLMTFTQKGCKLAIRCWLYPKRRKFLVWSKSWNSFSFEK